MRLVDAIAAKFGRGHDSGFEVEPFFPAASYGFLIDIGFGQLDEQMIMPGLAFHEPAVELAKVVILEAFAEPLEAFTAAGFDKREDQQPVEKAFLVRTDLFLEFHQLIYVLVFALAAECEAALLEFGKDKAEMAPFFGDEGG